MIRSGVQSMIYPVRSDLGFRDFKQGERGRRRGRRRGLQNPLKDWGENAIVARISKQLSSHYKMPLMKSLKEVRNQLLIIHDDGMINDNGTMMLTLRTILILVLTSMIWKTTRAFQSFTPTRTTYHFWLKIPEIVEYHQRSICSGLEALCNFLKSHSCPCRYSDMIARFGKPIPVLCVINNYMIDYIYQAHSHIIL